MMLRPILLMLVATGLLACTYSGQSSNSDLISQRATWFSYLDGEDIRAACTAGSPNRYRLVYNADFNRQARAYDVVPTGGGGAVLRQVVDRGIVLNQIRLTELRSIGAPGRAETPLTAEDVQHLEALLRASGAFEPPPVGLSLRSEEHFWVVNGCQDGAFFLTAYRYPSDRFDRIRFTDFLRAQDRTGIRFPAPSLPERRNSLAQCPTLRREGRVCFVQQVGEDGLIGDQSPF